MILPIAERLALIDILPQQGTAQQLRLVREVDDKVRPSDGEFARIGFKGEKADGGGINYTWTSESDVECEFSQPAVAFITELLTKLSSSGRLMRAQLPLYERFCGGD